MRLHLGTFYQLQYVNGKKAIFNVCAYTCSPNQHVDMNPHNDYKCDTFVYSGIEDNTKDIPRISIFPNPASDILHIQSDKLINANYELINTLGQTILSGKINNALSGTLNIETLPAGVYYIQLREENNISQLKFVKE